MSYPSPVEKRIANERTLSVIISLFLCAVFSSVVAFDLLNRSNIKAELPQTINQMQTPPAIQDYDKYCADHDCKG